MLPVLSLFEFQYSTRSEAPSSSLGWSERRRKQTTGASAHEIVSRGLRPATEDRIWNPPPTPLRRGTSGVCYIDEYNRKTDIYNLERD